MRTEIGSRLRNDPACRLVARLAGPPATSVVRFQRSPLSATSHSLRHSSLVSGHGRVVWAKAAYAPRAPPCISGPLSVTETTLATVMQQLHSWPVRASLRDLQLRTRRTSQASSSSSFVLPIKLHMARGGSEHVGVLLCTRAAVTDSRLGPRVRTFCARYEVTALGIAVSIGSVLWIESIPRPPPLARRPLVMVTEAHTSIVCMLLNKGDCNKQSCTIFSCNGPYYVVVVGSLCS